IVVSDPHYARDYLNSFDTLIKGLKLEFQDSNIRIAMHGNDQTIVKYAIENNIEYQNIYDDRHKGLEIYDNADLHVGYRVHAHVSTLKRRKYSYLLEQDGRGCDYGLTIERRISIPNFRKSASSFIVKVIFELMKRINFPITKVSSSPAEALIAMIKNDRKDGFSKFLNLELQIEKFSNDLVDELKKLP
ncbi:hypothetical protein L4D09_28810, partial [Photobacterium makurazakiensis]|uniref:hypothetical protein n=1 Tax=Photobacterium makurazakiensis TaxID=2910234 RepID=UPI003D138064